MKNRFILFVIFLFFSTIVSAQETDQVEKYRKDSEDLISFLEYVFNALGNSELSVSDKDVIISESYLKAFKDSQVQIEDDLISGREVSINKDVQAYLKDIDFFFRSASFELRVEEITQGINENGELFFTVKVNRHLQAIGIDGDSVNNSLTRFVELNVDPKEKELKIASVYTTKLGEKAALARWWISLSPAWKTILGKDLMVSEVYQLIDFSVLNDSTFLVGGDRIDPSVYDVFGAIRKAAEIKELDISGRKDITGIEPLYELSQLQTLNISNTGVSSLFPIRNLTTLQTLDCSNTLIDDIQPLRYSTSLVDLTISNTNVIDISVVPGFKKLKSLNAANLQIDSLEAISACASLNSLNLHGNYKVVDVGFLKPLAQLKTLDVSSTTIDDVSGLNALSNLEDLNISGTSINNIAPLAENKKLKSLNIERTEVEMIGPLLATQVSKIYCDGAKVDREEVVAFLLEKPETEIIFLSDDLKSWWQGMDPVWKDILFSKLELEGEPTSEILHQLIRVDSVDVHGNKKITNLTPLENLLFLKKVNVSGTSISDLSQLSEQQFLEVINFANTNVADISVLKGKQHLTKIIGNSSKVEDIAPLAGLEKLQYINLDSTEVKDVSAINELPAFKIGYFDHTNVTDNEVVELNYDGEASILVYKTDRLRDWWGHLDDEWQDIFREALDFNRTPLREEIHKLTGLKKFVVKSILIKDISVMQEFIRLRELAFNDTQISNIGPLSKMKKLEVLDISRNPIEELAPISKLENLRILYAENTQISDIDALEGLTLVEELKISNTEVKDLGPVEQMKNLKVLEISNTRVRNLKEIMGLTELKSLRCFNSNINEKRVDEFKAAHPNCEVVYY